MDCVDEEMLGWMRRAGCTQISYGVESGSPKIREIFRKRITNKAIENAFDLTVRYGIMARAYFIYGAPGETDETIEESLALIRRIRPLSAIFYILDLFPGTELYEDFKKRSGADDDMWLDRVEDILYFETDGMLNKKEVLDFGRQLREGYFARLTGFARKVELVEDPELYPLHADFLSRLALTFSHGDYAVNPLIKDKIETAIDLFKRSLTYHPDHRAYWGLGLVYQHQQQFEKAVAVLEQGSAHHPGSIDLHVTLSDNLMRLQRYTEACHRLKAFPDHPMAVERIILCCRFMNDREQEQKWMKRLQQHRSESLS